MKHFSEADWSDFARKLVPADVGMAMQQHIDEGCTRCKAILEIWQGLLAFAGQESSFIPPADVVRVAKSQFSAVAPQASRGVRLVFDSMLQPAAAGLRGSVTARQFLFETDDYYIDLRLEPRSAVDRACLVGQVLNRTGEERAAQGVKVRLQEGKQPIAQTSTNRFGEFQLEFDAGNGICISISREQGNEIILPLYGAHVKPLEGKDLD